MGGGKFIDGLNTMTQTLFGTRLPVVMGGSYTYLPANLSMVLAGRYSGALGPQGELTVIKQDITAVIKQDITALNYVVVDLRVLCNSRNESENMSRDTTTHSTTVVDNSKNTLMSTTREFKDVLTMRIEGIWLCEHRDDATPRIVVVTLNGI